MSLEFNRLGNPQNIYNQKIVAIGGDTYLFMNADGINIVTPSGNNKVFFDDLSGVFFPLFFQFFPGEIQVFYTERRDSGGISDFVFKTQLDPPRIQIPDQKITPVSSVVSGSNYYTDSIPTSSETSFCSMWQSYITGISVDQYGIEVYFGVDTQPKLMCYVFNDSIAQTQFVNGDYIHINNVTYPIYNNGRIYKFDTIVPQPVPPAFPQKNDQIGSTIPSYKTFVGLEAPGAFIDTQPILTPNSEIRNAPFGYANQCIYNVDGDGVLENINNDSGIQEVKEVTYSIDASSLVNWRKYAV